MTFLIFGLGSIGQRHVRLLRRARPECRIIAVQERRRQLIIHDDLSTSPGDPVQFYGIESASLVDIESVHADAGFVTNPISLHTDILRYLVHRGIPAFVEKPLADRLGDLPELVSAAGERGCTGYNLRWHPAAQFIKGVLERQELGRIHGAKLHFGEWLAGIRTFEDYRQTHMARRDQGGGVTLCLSHEIDLARYLFGEPGEVRAFGGKFSDLEIETEDTLEAILAFKNETAAFPVNLSLNFLDRPTQRWMVVHGERGVLRWDYFENRVTVKSAEGTITRTEFPQFYRNLTFERQLKNFLAVIEGAEKPLCSLQDGLRTLELSLRLREAACLS
jgi:predicted dehydrogenase